MYIGLNVHFPSIYPAELIISILAPRDRAHPALNLSKMPHTVHCVRHAQGFHNLSEANHNMHDPSLTPFGEQQCATLRETFPYHDKICLLVSSPLRRTIYTTLLSFTPALNNGRCPQNIVALPEMQESSDFPCDTGSDPDQLVKEMAENHVPVDLSLVKEGWNVKKLDSKWAPTSEALSKRAREARIYIRDRILDLEKGGEKSPEIIVVTHGGFLHYFTEDWEDSGAYNGTSWRNTEYRSFNFADLNHSSTSESINGTQSNEHLDDYENATLRETKESRARRGKEEPQHGRDKQAELFNAAMWGWKDQGMQNPDKIGEVGEEGDEEEALVRMLTKGSENVDKKGGEAPAKDRMGESTVDAVAKERERSRSLSVRVAA
ncbi:hypothetical protein GJ744_006278 [Endocarpon pusillum]|uniref:Phosphoglycerate mutase family protein n=1 Tax=Endocarpon pusillum TaxID=364733 RepID=A0A8H7DY30_9EURO|nr:hypothetical protein GJ744_006278 [Endocarpon pusillum]